MKCPYCPSAQGRCATTSSGRSITECASCGHVIEERQSQPHHFFHLRSQDNPLCLVTSDLPSHLENDENDPFEPTGFITAFSTWSIEPNPLFLRSSLSFSGHLAELERTLESSSSSSSSSTVVVDNLRAYMQIIDVASILGLEYEISDHAFQLFRDCCSATCLRNRSVEALATAALVQAIREAQEPRTLQEISIAANVPQKEIGKYIKILGEALQLSQPINSNSISVHMPRFCTLLQLNKSAQELATHIGEVVINKCFCTRRNPISISAAAIYLACQLEDKRKTQAEICKVTGLTEVTLRKVYKELLENWDDLLPSNYTPAVPPERAFPTTVIASGRSSAPKGDLVEGNSSLEREKLQEIKVNKPDEVPDMGHQARAKEEAESRGNSQGPSNPVLNQPTAFWQAQATIGTSGPRGDNNQNITQGTDINELHSNSQELEQKVDKDANGVTNSLKPNQLSSPPASSGGSVMHVWSPYMSQPPNIPVVKPPKVERDSNQNITRGTDINRLHSNHQELEHRVDKDASGTDSLKPNQLSSPPTSSASSVTQAWSSYMSLPLNIPVVKPPKVEGDNNQNITRGTDINRLHSNHQELEHRVDKGANGATNSLKPIQLSSPPASSASPVMQAWSAYMSEPLHIPPNVVRDNHQGTDINRLHSNHQMLEHKVVKGANGATNSLKPNQLSSSPTLNVSSIHHQYWSSYMPKPQSIPCQNITGGTDINELHSIRQELGHNILDEDANGATNSLKPNQLSSSAISSENSVMQVWSSYMSQPLNIPVVNVVRDNNRNITRGTNINQLHSNRQELEHKVDKGANGATNSLKPNQLSSPPTSSSSSVGQYWAPYMSRPLNVPVVQTPNVVSGYAEPKRSGSLNGSRSANQCGDK